MRNLKQTSFVLHKPVIIAQAEPGQRAWGYHQFPEIEKLSDGRLHVRYHISPDSARSYGLGKGHAISDDDGLTWTETANEPVNGGILLSNGDSLRIKHLPSVPLDQVMIDRLPRYQTENYGISVDIYDTDCFPEKMNGWPLERRPAGSMKWILEMKTIDFPGDVRHTCEDVLPWRMFWRLRQAPDKAVWAIAYTYVFMDDHSVSITPLFFRSNDDGCSFHFVSMIPYVSDPTADSKAALRCGFTEPDITFLPNGDLFVF